MEKLQALCGFMEGRWRPPSEPAPSPRQARGKPPVCVIAPFALAARERRLRRAPRGRNSGPPRAARSRRRDLLSVSVRKETNVATKAQQIADLEDKLRRLRAEAKKKDRRDETRRKILYGAALLALADSVEEAQRNLIMKRIDPFISRSVDREFLGLIPSSPAHATPAPACDASLYGTSEEPTFND